MISYLLYQGGDRMEILRLEGLSKYYTSQTSVVMGLTNINLSFHTGEFVAITGESGSGKSTLAHVIGGILPYESGEMYINGRPTSHYDDFDREKYRRDEIGFISQNYGILEGNSVLENILCTLRFCSISGKEAKCIAENVLKKVDLYDLKSRRAGKLSSGQKQRLSIARALAKPSKIIIADEPTGNLDRENSEKVIELLKHASRDRLVLLITHEFDEARDAATRKITMKDGSVVSDSRLSSPSSEATPVKKPCGKVKQHGLFSYTAALLLRSHPIFTSLICLLLAFTSFMMFAFLGTFIASLDESSVKIYSPAAFPNGDPTRIVVMKPDSTAFDDDDIGKIDGLSHVQSVEKRGYVSDFVYYYLPSVDYKEYSYSVNGPNYHPVENPFDIELKDAVEFLDNDKFIKSSSNITEDDLSSGRLAEGVYEVVSADDRYKLGDTVKVYIRDSRDWSESIFVAASFSVVGETESGEGLLFSDKLAAALSRSSVTLAEDKDVRLAGYTTVLLLPHNSLFEEKGMNALEDGEFAMSPVLAQQYKYSLTEGDKKIMSYLSVGEKKFDMGLAQVCELTHPKLIVVSQESFDEILDLSPSNQITVYAEDYAYADRVCESLKAEGYLTISPFVSGSTEVDITLANERYATLGICIGALVLAVILQLILLRAIFSALNRYLKLMSDLGMTWRTAKGSVSLMLLICTLSGEIITALTVLILNSLKLERIVEIFKYLDIPALSALWAVHIISVALALPFMLRSARKSLFKTRKSGFDLDLLEEVEDNA